MIGLADGYSDKFEWQALDNTAQRGAKRRRELDVAVHHRQTAEPGIHLNHLRFQLFFFEESFGQSHLINRGGITPARIRNADFWKSLSACGIQPHPKKKKGRQ